MTLPLHRAPVPLLAGLAEFGNRPALLSHGADPVSYAALADLVAERARVLGASRRLVLLAMRPEVDVIVDYLACLNAGHPVMLTSPDPDRIDSLVRAYDPDVVLDRGLDERRSESRHELHPDLALLLSTSGSTGSPKLVRLSRDNVQANATAIAWSLGIRAEDRAITSLPLHYCYGLSVLTSHLASGAGLILTSASVVDPCFWQAFDNLGATTLAGVPHTFTLLDRIGFADRDYPRLRYLTQAGGRMPPERVRAYSDLGRRRGFDFVVMYGQTEATARMSVLPPDLAPSRPGTIGHALPGGSFRLEPVPEATWPVGELVYEGPNVMLGYAHEPHELALGRTVTELRTGDLARCGADGLHEVVGRRSSFVKVLGHRIDVERVEAELALLGCVVACAASDDELLVATETASTQLRAQAAKVAGLPISAVRTHAVACLPRTDTGKLDRVALRALCAPAQRADVRVETVGQVLASVLERDDVADDSSFVSLGGDSLSYVEASLRLEQLLGDLPADWHLRTVADLERGERLAPRRTRAVETSTLLRAIAIVLIVAHHSHLFRLLGGAHLLLGVAGFNFARFRLTSADRTHRLRANAIGLRRIAVPALVVLAVGTVVTGTYSGVQLLLVHDLVDPMGGNKDLWFIEVLLQTVAVSALLVSVPAIDRFERRAPFALPVVLLGVGLLARYDVLPSGTGKERLYAPFAVFWLFAWGWAAARTTRVAQRLVLTAVLLVALPGFFLDNPWREAIVGAALLLLLWVPQVRVPRRVVPVVAVLASSSLYVYVAHYGPARAFADVPLLAMAASFAAGLAYWQLARHAGRVLAWGVRVRAGSARPTPRRSTPARLRSAA